MFCHAGPSSLVVFAGCFEILLSDFQLHKATYGEVHCDKISNDF